MEKRERAIHQVFEDFNTNNSNLLKPEQVIELADAIEGVNKSSTSMAKVKEFMTTFGQVVLPKPAFPPREIIDLRLSLMLEELTELAEACGSDVLSAFGTSLKDKADAIRDLVERERENLKPNIVAVQDAIGDSQYVLDGAALAFGLGETNEPSFDEIHDSNMSKACFTLAEAEETKEHYLKQGINVEINPHEHYYLIKRTRDNKVLKSINYRPANLTPIINGVSNKI